MSEPIRVLLVDDQALVRAGFRMVIDTQADLDVVAEVDDGLAAVQWVAEHPGGCDVALMDIRMPQMDGVEATRRILGQAGQAAPRVIVLTTFDADEYVWASLQAGASGFLLKDAGPTELLAAIRAVHAGDAAMAPSVTRRLLHRCVPHLGDDATPAPSTGTEHPGLRELTERERDVLLAVAQGRTNAEIAAELFLAESTVKTHLGRVLTKLGARDRVQLVILAYEAGLVQR